jgi:hypothetical protein
MREITKNKVLHVTNIALTTIPIAVSVGLLIHHRFKHNNDVYFDNPNPKNIDGTQFTEADKWFQLTDINNNETWALFFSGVGLGRLTKK